MLEIKEFATQQLGWCLEKQLEFLPEKLDHLTLKKKQELTEILEPLEEYSRDCRILSRKYDKMIQRYEEWELLPEAERTELEKTYKQLKNKTLKVQKFIFKHTKD